MVIIYDEIDLKRYIFFLYLHILLIIILNKTCRNEIITIIMMVPFLFIACACVYLCLGQDVHGIIGNLFVIVCLKIREINQFNTKILLVTLS